MFRKIVICVDGSENAERAAKQGEELALRYAATVVLLYVINPLPSLASYEMAVTDALPTSEPVDMTLVMHQVVADLAPLARQKH